MRHKEGVDSPVKFKLEAGRESKKGEQDLGYLCGNSIMFLKMM